HYCQRTQSWTCSAAPIYNGNKLIGALQMSGPSSKTHLHTLGMVVAAVEAIEHEIKVKRQNSNLILLNNQLKQIFLTVSDGVIVVNKEGRIKQINPVAKTFINNNSQKKLNTFINQIPTIEQ